MKNIALVLILFLTITKSYSQEFKSLFGSETTQWNITIGNLWGYSSTEHFIFGDTIIDNKVYKLINGYQGFDEMIGFIRQDSLNEKAWYKNNQTTDEILIMDLSLEIGDSLFIQGVWNGDHKYYLVDSIYFNNGRKFIQFDFPINVPYIQYNNKFTIIEGVVSNMGFRYQDNDYINGIPTILLCAFKNDEKVFGDGECVFSSFENVSLIQNVNLFPNPVVNELKIELNPTIIKGEISIIDQQGREIHKLCGSFNNEEVMDLGNLNNGLYFVRIYNYKTHEQTIKKILKVTNNM